MITSLAHTAVCVPDIEAAVGWYRDVLGLTVLSPPYLMEGDDIRGDMGELVADPRLKAAIVGFPGAGDRVLEIIEYVDAAGRDRPRLFADHGISHIGLVVDDIESTRAELEARGVRFLTTGVADIMRLRTAWFEDPWGVVFILMEKARPDRSYYDQFA